MLEIAANHVGDTFRAVYTVKFATAIYVLHAFRKKSKTGIKTPAEGESCKTQQSRTSFEVKRLISKKRDF